MYSRDLYHTIHVGTDEEVLSLIRKYENVTPIDFIE
ncbi:MPPV-349 C-type lectin-like protein [Magpiepox virus 2]|nr:MPPV-004 C-type lectin-like protein [Magpiepox virus 2]QZW33680.1 MPPV-349 C-type lectin-like protein [Magpiepox virus 2]